jgi:hypothetical protein
MVLPEFVGEEREQGNRQENAEKRQCPGKGEFGSVQIGCMSGIRKEQGDEQNNERKPHASLLPCEAWEKVAEGRMRALSCHMRRFQKLFALETKSPHPPFGHPLPSCGRERGKTGDDSPTARIQGGGDFECRMSHSRSIYHLVDLIA